MLINTKKPSGRTQWRWTRPLMAVKPLPAGIWSHFTRCIVGRHVILIPPPPRTDSIPPSHCPAPSLPLCSRLQVGRRRRAQQTRDPAAVQDSWHASHSRHDNCGVNEHTTRRSTSRQASWKSYTAAVGGVANCRLMLIISHGVVSGAGGGGGRLTCTEQVVGGRLIGRSGDPLQIPARFFPTTGPAQNINRMKRPTVLSFSFICTQTRNTQKKKH